MARLGRGLPGTVLQVRGPLIPAALTTPSSIAVVTAVPTPVVAATRNATVSPAVVVVVVGSAQPGTAVGAGGTTNPASLTVSASVPVLVAPVSPGGTTSTPAAKMYGASDNFYDLADRSTLVGEYTFNASDVGSWAFGPGKSAGWATFCDGHVFLGNSGLGGPLNPSSDHMAVSVFNAATETISHVVIPTSTSEVTAVVPGDDVGGSEVNDADVVRVAGEDWVVLVSALPYKGWEIATTGLYPSLLVFRKSGGTWQYDGAKSKTADDLRASSAAGASAFPLKTNAFAETYAYDRAMAEIAVTPVSQTILAVQYFNDSDVTPPSNKGGGLVAIDPGTGTVLAHYLNPYDGEDSRVHDMGPRAICTDPTGATGREVFAVVYDAYVGPGVGASIKPAQLFNWDSTTNTITALTAPFVTNSPIGYDSAGSIFFDSDGNLWIVEQGGFLDAGDTVVYANRAGIRSPEFLAPFRGSFSNFGAPVDPDHRVASRPGVSFPFGRPLEDVATRTVFWHSATGKVVPIKRMGRGDRLRVKRGRDIELGYKFGIEAQQSSPHGIIAPSDGCVDPAGRKAYYGLAQLDSAGTDALAKPHSLDQWMVRLDMRRLWDEPKFVASSGGVEWAAADVDPPLPEWRVGDTVLIFVNLAGGEDRQLSHVRGWRKEWEDYRDFFGFGSRWALYSRYMNKAQPELNRSPHIAWTGGVVNADWVGITLRGTFPCEVVAVAGTVGAPAGTISRPSVTTRRSRTRIVGFYGADGSQSFSGLNGEVRRNSDNGGTLSPSSMVTDEELIVPAHSVSESRTVTLLEAKQNVGVTVALAPVIGPDPEHTWVHSIAALSSVKVPG